MDGEIVEALFRREFGRVVSTLTRIFGPRYLALAEDVAQEALIKALQQWPHRGVPANPAAWLTQVAKNLALDSLRREASLAAKAPEIARALSPAATQPEVIDDQLAMMFLCCHPEIPRDGGIALTLKTVCGFGTGEIARAFLIQETTAAQRIVRAKKLIRERDLTFELPDHQLPRDRLDSVLEALYLMFNEGYASGGDQLLRRDLCEEAIRLARLTASHPATRAPQCDALLALFLLQSAREPARVDDRGDLFLLREQDRSLWDRSRIAEGILHLGRCADGDRLTRYHLEAGIAAEHGAAPDFAATNWASIAEQYEQLLALNPSPVVALNRAVALAQAHGAAAGLRELEKIEHHPALQRYHLLPAAMGALWRELGDARAAERYLKRALACECSAPERRLLEKQIGELSVSFPKVSIPCR
jgi:RNA polymerase sigma-70 factor (ECF subfamily)